MPICGSQVTLCDLPIRYDTYVGCGHGCTYCFVSRKKNIDDIARGESAKGLRSFIDGKRTQTTNWCDWDIPIHWGGLSDPFQPIERKEKRSLDALKVFAETGYPFVVSTKSTLISEEPYLSILKQCNVVVQFSACSPKFDAIEKGAATYAERIRAASIIAPFKRVNIRIQPFSPLIAKDIYDAIPEYRNVGIHGIIVEGMKFTKPKFDCLVPHGKDYVYPVEILLQHFGQIKERAHSYGLKFYCGENRLRAMSDELCCCGIEGLGWKGNEANLNHFLFDPAGVKFSENMQEVGTAECFVASHQDTMSRIRLTKSSFADAMKEEAKKPYMFENQRGGADYRSNQKCKSENISGPLSIGPERVGRMSINTSEQMGWPVTILANRNGHSQLRKHMNDCGKFCRYQKRRICLTCSASSISGPEYMAA